MINHSTEEQDRMAQNDNVMDKMLAAVAAGDSDAEMEQFRQLTLPADALLALKINAGTDWIIELGLDTSEADLKFGKNWMERDHVELITLLHA